MSCVTELVELLAATPSPRTLLIQHPKFVAPPYMVDPVTKVSGAFHAPPYNAEESAAIREAKIAADISGEQTRGDVVFPNLMIGNLFAAQDAEWLHREGVTHLLNTAGLESAPDCVRPDIGELEKKGIQLLSLQLDDRATVPISSHFPETGAWIHKALREGGKVMVNCWQGASRSTSVVIAYLVQYQGLSLKDALVMVKKCRDIRPNDGFLQQLLDWEQTCRDTVQVQ